MGLICDISIAMKARKPRMGRPPLPPSKRRTTEIAVAMTKAEAAMLKGEAHKRGLTASELFMLPWRQGHVR